MPKYHVHIYPVVRVLVRDVEAESQEEACKKAEAMVDLDHCFYNVHSLRPGGQVLAGEYADAVDGFLVDEDGDAEHAKSTFYDAEYHPL